MSDGSDSEVAETTTALAACSAEPTPPPPKYTWSIHSADDLRREIGVSRERNKALGQENNALKVEHDANKASFKRFRAQWEARSDRVNQIREQISILDQQLEDEATDEEEAEELRTEVVELLLELSTHADENAVIAGLMEFFDKREDTTAKRLDETLFTVLAREAKRQVSELNV